MSKPKILTADIETTPNLAHVWSLWQQNVSLAQLREATRVFSFAAKWYGESRVIFKSEYHDGYSELVQAAHALLDEADIVVHYNGTTFDVPHLQREFLQAGLTPPSPFQQVDLLRAVKKQFRFPSNKLDWVSQAVGLKGKLSHTGHQLWVDCMAGDEKAWALMKKYNVQDVRLTEELYDKLRPWIPNHPHLGLFVGEDQACARCGSTEQEKRGLKAVGVSLYQQYRCKGCGGWSRGAKALSRMDMRAVS